MERQHAESQCHKEQLKSLSRAQSQSQYGNCDILVLAAPIHGSVEAHAITAQIMCRILLIFRWAANFNCCRIFSLGINLTTCMDDLEGFPFLVESWSSPVTIPCLWSVAIRPGVLPDCAAAEDATAVSVCCLFFFRLLRFRRAFFVCFKFFKISPSSMNTISKRHPRVLYERLKFTERS